MPSSNILTAFESGFLQVNNIQSKVIANDFAGAGFTSEDIQKADHIRVTVYNENVRYDWSGGIPTPTTKRQLAVNEELVVTGNRNIRNLAFISESITNAHLWITLSTHGSVPDVVEEEFLLNDEFVTDEVAPLFSPRVAEPGSGTLTLIQNDGQFSISGGKLQIPAQSTPVWGDLSFYGEQQSIGSKALALVGVINHTTRDSQMFGWWPTTSIGANPRIAWFPFTTDIDARVAADTIQIGFPFLASTDYPVAVVWTPSRYYLYIRDTSGTWQLRWILTQADTDMYPGLANFDAAGTLDNFRLPELAASLFDPAISVASPVVNTGSVSPGTDPKLPDADFRMEFDLDTLPTTGSLIIPFRYVDADNQWRITTNTSGDFFVVEEVDGSSTARITAALALTGGEHITLEARGNTITAWEDTALLGTYASADTFLREQDWTVEFLSGGSISNLEIWKAYARNEVGLGAESVTNGDFSAWTADDPDNWTVTEDATDTVSRDGTNDVVVFDDGGSIGNGPQISQDMGLDVNKYYRATIVVDSITAGTLAFRTGGVTFLQMTQPGTFMVNFVPTDVFANLLMLGIGIAKVSSISVKEIQFSPDALGSEFNLGVS